MVQKLGGAVWIGWDTETDKFSVPLTVNISKSRTGLTTGPDVTIATMVMLEEAVLTRRRALSITMSLYDPLRFICPLTIRLKWLLQQLGSKETGKGWDVQLLKEAQKPWTDFLRLMVTQKCI